MEETQVSTTYYEELKAMLSSSEYDSINNDERFHNAEITRLFLEEGGHIRMFCGEMSVFRSSFYDHISLEKGAEVANHLRSIIEDRLQEFFNNPDNKLDIVLAKPAKFSEMKDLLCDSLFWYKLGTPALTIKVGKPWVRESRILDHYMYSTKRMMRLEDDPVKHSGFFATNLPDDYYEEIDTTYSEISKGATPISL